MWLGWPAKYSVKHIITYMITTEKNQRNYQEIMYKRLESRSSVKFKIIKIQIIHL